MTDKTEPERSLKVSRPLIEKLQRDIRTAQYSPSAYDRNRSIFVSTLLLKRLEQGLTQAQLAKRTSLRQPAIARIESGKTNPKLDTLIKIASALNCKLMLK